MDATLSSLAILKVEWDAGRDYIQSFLPFLLEALRTIDDQLFSLPKVQTFIQEEFGLRIPQAALKTIMHRAVRAGYLFRSEGVYHKVREKLFDDSFRKRRADAVRQHQALVARLIQYASQNHSIEWDSAIAEGLLLSFLRKQFVPILTAAIEGDPIELAEYQDAKAEFVIASFIRHIEREDPEAFGFLETLAKGLMLSSVLCFPTIGDAKQRFTDAKIILDTPVILRVLGLTASDERAYYDEMIDLLYELNAQIYCFEHTLREIRGVLHAASTALSRPNMLRYSRADAIEYFIRAGSTSSDVELILARLENHLANHHIRILPNPPYEDATTIDEEILGQLLMERVGYQHERTMEHDLRAIACIFALRSGSFPQNIERCKAIFVTNNIEVVKTSMDFFRSQYGEASSFVPLVLPDHIVATLAWLKKPQRAPDLPEKILAANCYAALNPPDRLWRLYLQEIESLAETGEISEEDYYLLRFSSEARHLLMNETLGEPMAFSEGTVQDILAHAKETIRKDLSKELEEERLARLRAEKEAKRYRESVRFRIRTISAKIARTLSWALAFLAAVAIIIAEIYALLEFPVIKRVPASAFIIAPISFAVIFRLADALCGISLESARRTIENSTRRKMESVLLEFLGDMPIYGGETEARRASPIEE